MHHSGDLLLSSFGTDKIKICSDFNRHGEGHLPRQSALLTVHIPLKVLAGPAGGGDLSDNTDQTRNPAV